MHPSADLPRADQTTIERAELLAPFGVTERQARFPATVMLHSGVFVGRQYAAFSGVTHGQKVHDFVERLLIRRFVTPPRGRGENSGGGGNGGPEGQDSEAKKVSAYARERQRQVLRRDRLRWLLRLAGLPRRSSPKASEVWWRRRESNPRPKARRRGTLHACPLLCSMFSCPA
jgi:hypothetical protein